MSDPNEAPKGPPESQSPIGWFVFNNRDVMLQLKEPYIGVTYGYMPSKNKEGGVLASPVLSGRLFVMLGDEIRVMLVIRCPIPNSEDFAIISVQPEDVLHCTTIDRKTESNIVTPG